MSEHIAWPTGPEPIGAELTFTKRGKTFTGVCVAFRPAVMINVRTMKDVEGAIDLLLCVLDA